MRWRQRRAAAAGSGAPGSEPLDRPALSADDEQWEAIAVARLVRATGITVGRRGWYREQHDAPLAGYEPPLSPREEHATAQPADLLPRKDRGLNAGHADEGERVRCRTRSGRRV